jgi:hypothetical protein
MKNKILSWIKVLLFNFLAIIIILAIVDPFIPYLTKQKNGQNVRSIRLQEHKPNLDYILKQDGLRFKVRTDENGYIVGPGLLKKNQHIDYLFVGSSTTECLLVNEENRIPFKAIELINKKLNTDYNSLNGGIGSNNLSHIYLSLLAKNEKVDIKNLVLIAGTADFGYLNLTGNYYDGPRGNLIENKMIFFNLLKLTKDTFFSNFYIFLRGILDFRIKTLHGGPDDYEKFRENNFLETSYNIVADKYIKQLELIKEYCRINDINFYILSEFYSGKKVEETFDINMYRDSIGKILEDFSTKNEIKYFDLYKTFPKEKKYFSDGFHLNDQGSILASEFISSFILNNMYE